MLEAGQRIDPAGKGQGPAEIGQLAHQIKHVCAEHRAVMHLDQHHQRIALVEVVLQCFERQQLRIVVAEVSAEVGIERQSERRRRQQ
jgi:hypothetical protein